MNKAEPWRIEVSGLDFGDSDPPDSLIGFASPTVSPQTTFSLTLTDKDEMGVKDGVYSVGFDPDAVLKSGAELANTRFSVGAGVVVTDNSGVTLISHRFADLLVETLLAANFYPQQKKQLGQLVYTGTRKVGNDGQIKTEVGLNEAEFHKENLKKFGFEAVTIVVLTPRGPLDAVVKVQNKASTFATFCHGLHDGKLFLGSGSGGSLASSDLTEEEVSHLKTWIFNACNVLICYDYNNNLANRADLGRQGPDDPISVRQSGAHGMEWWRKLNKGQTILLGYNFPVDVGNAGDAFSVYRGELDSSDLAFLGVRIDAQNRQQWAWMVANARIGSTAWNACAWDSKYYYYLGKYRRELDPVDESEGKPKSTISGIVRLPLSATGVPSYRENNSDVTIVPRNPQGVPKGAMVFPVP